MKTEIVELTPQNISEFGVCGYKDIKKHKELSNKIDWYAKYYPKGLRIKALLVDGLYQGMIEYMPGKYAYRPVEASQYLFIQCIFTGFKKDYKKKGFGSMLIDECVTDAKNLKMKGIASLTRKSSFMASPDIFIKNRFIFGDSVKPDFSIVYKPFDKSAEAPVFKDQVNKGVSDYEKGLYILRSVQCPYTEKNVNVIVETSKSKYNIEASIVNLEDHIDVQNSPCPFGTFGIIYNGDIIAHHPISNTRFENIMKNMVC